jgi:hypothetical protein
MPLSTANDNVAEPDRLTEAHVRVTVPIKFQLVLAFVRQREVKSDREHLRHGHALHRKSIPRRGHGPDGEHPVHRLLHRTLEPDVCIAPLRTRHGLVKSDLECDALTDPQSISLEELSSDREFRVRVEESLDIPSAAESDVIDSIAAC